ncbi:hypothetical protein PPSIR1_22861 [Plesiocystis pacifica SIR-1]|uniref:Uncharacterized protein n=1 Tax=Plesiocystis pacifica SIR-1 TaxID=391625 RepID=A6G2J5_9BACT|nr:hypothetical protein [Plesiocystis pacifica]EDM79932.1 hypothetical protein PPSIR1_22861 [Plesiocystis pacifica SIR-1]
MRKLAISGSPEAPARVLASQIVASMWPMPAARAASARKATKGALSRW